MTIAPYYDRGALVMPCRLTARIMPVSSQIIVTEPLGERARALLPQNHCVEDSNYILDYYRRTADEVLVFRFPVTAGRHTIGITFPSVNAEREGVWIPEVTDYAFGRDYGHFDVEPAVGRRQRDGLDRVSLHLGLLSA